MFWSNLLFTHLRNYHSFLFPQEVELFTNIQSRRSFHLAWVTLISSIAPCSLTLQRVVFNYSNTICSTGVLRPVSLQLLQTWRTCWLRHGFFTYSIQYSQKVQLKRVCSSQRCQPATGTCAVTLERSFILEEF